MAEDYVIEMLHITKEFPGIKANDDITLQLRKGEVHALLGENGHFLAIYAWQMPVDTGAALQTLIIAQGRQVCQ